MFAALVVALGATPGAPGPLIHPRPIAGRIMLQTARDTVAAPGARVILHRVTVARSGPVDSTVADLHGRFRFQLTPDSGAIYLISGRWSGVEYFAAPLDLRDVAADTAVTVLVADTSSRAPVQLAARHLIVSPVDSDGVRDVVDLMVLDNPGAVTRVAVDSLRGSWSVRLPDFAVNLHGGNSDFSLDALIPHGDTVTLIAPIPPGRRDIELDYQIPPKSREFTIVPDHDAAVSNIISADRSMRVDGPFVRSDTVIDRKPYARWQGHLVKGQPITLVFGGRGAPHWLMPVMLAIMAALLAGVTWTAAHRDRRTPVARERPLA
jgi:hypothetical protein